MCETKREVWGEVRYAECGEGDHDPMSEKQEPEAAGGKMKAIHLIHFRRLQIYIEKLRDALKESERLRLAENQRTAAMIAEKREAEVVRDRALSKVEALEKELRDARE